MVFEAHRMTFPCTEMFKSCVLMIYYSTMPMQYTVYTVFHSMAPLRSTEKNNTGLDHLDQAEIE